MAVLVTGAHQNLEVPTYLSIRLQDKPQAQPFHHCSFSIIQNFCRYAAPLYIDMRKTVITRTPADEEGGPVEEQEEEERFEKVFVGEVSQYLRVFVCWS